ncbi:MAG: amidohydrolase family protein [Hyphomicrobiaceae bacterium]
MNTQRIDCDIHPSVGGTRTTLLPYLSEHWQEQVVSRAIDGLDLTSYPPDMPLSCRSDWRCKAGKPAEFQKIVSRQALDELGSGYAICNVLYGAQAVFDPYMAQDFCKAINDWIKSEWLDADPRLRASMCVPMQAPDLVIDEINRLKDDRRFVSILVLAQGDVPLGNRQWWPVYELAERLQLPLTIHAGSAYRRAPSSVGWPSYRYEYYMVESQAIQSQVLSLILDGVFSKFPSLKVVLAESGVSWLPAFMWRANKTWRGVRVEVPWVDRQPSDILRDSIRVTTQPFDCPADPSTVEQLIEQIGSDEMFLFSSDYPHWQFEGSSPIPPHFPGRLVEKMSLENPLATFPRLELIS